MRGRAHNFNLPEEGLSSVWNSEEGKVLWPDRFCCLQRVFLDHRRILKGGRDFDGWRDMSTLFKRIGSRFRKIFIQILALLLPSSITLNRLLNHLNFCFCVSKME